MLALPPQMHKVGLKCANGYHLALPTGNPVLTAAQKSHWKHCSPTQPEQHFSLLSYVATSEYCQQRQEQKPPLGQKLFLVLSLEFILSDATLCSVMPLYF